MTQTIHQMALSRKKSKENKNHFVHTFLYKCFLSVVFLNINMLNKIGLVILSPDNYDKWQPTNGWKNDVDCGIQESGT